ncbi:hypothetical protein ACFL4T_05250 [candidate division KSB1 bacterium]
MRTIEKNISIIMIFVLITGLGCKKSSTPPEDEDNFTDLSGEYLGQELPGMAVERFAPESLLSSSAWWWHGAPVFSPDGRELYFDKYIVGGPRVEIHYMKLQNGRWTFPQRVPFYSSDGDKNARFSNDGNRLFFKSSRSGGGIFYVDRTGNAWSTPQNLNIPIPSSLRLGWQFSMAEDQTLYFELWDDNDPDIYCSVLVNGQYEYPENLGERINSPYNEFAPYIDPKEGYLIFTSNRPGGHGMHDLYISFKTQENSWSDAINMGSTINSYNEDSQPLISPDGNCFFFVSVRPGVQAYNPYWIDAQIIEDLRPAELK